MLIVSLSKLDQWVKKEKNGFLFLYIYKPLSENSQYYLDVLIDFLDFHQNKSDKKPVLWKISLKLGSNVHFHY